MPQGRMLNKKISYDEKIAMLSLKAKFLYTWCIPHLDVKGRIYAIPDYIKGNIVPLAKEIKMKEISKLLEEIQNADLIILYGANNMYMEFKGFLSNQSINPDREAKSIIPEPDPEQLQSNSRATPQQVKLSKDKISKDMCVDILSYFNIICKKSLTMTPERDRIIRANFKADRTAEQIKQAIDNFSKDDWPDRHKYCDLVYAIGVRKGVDNFDKWYNAESKGKSSIMKFFKKDKS